MEWGMMEVQSESIGESQDRGLLARISRNGRRWGKDLSTN